MGFIIIRIIIKIFNTPKKKENVEDWTARAVDVATRIHTDANWNQATLNWHLVRRQTYIKKKKNQDLK